MSDATQRKRRSAGLLGIVLVTLLAAAPRVAQLDHNPFVDELNHVLAARSLLEVGTLQVNGGDEYDRARLFTYLVAAALAVGPDTLVTARVPALLAGVATVVVLFVWVRRRAGPGAAWLAAMLLAFNPDSIFLSQTARFYTWQVLCLLVGSLAVVEALEPGGSRRRRAALAVVAASALLLALHFQILSAVGIAGLALWVIVDHGPASVRRVAAHPRRVPIVAAALAVVALGVAAVLVSGFHRTAWDMFNFVALTAESQRHEIRYYHWLWLDRYPTLWALLPAAAIVGFARARRVTLFAGCVFLTGFVFHSLAAWKTPRYIVWTLPFFFALWGVAGSAMLSRVGSAAEAAIATLRPGPRLARGVAAIAVAVVVGFAALGNPAFSFAARMTLVSDDDWGNDKSMRGEPGWAQAAPSLREWADASSVVVSSSGLKAIYYLGRLDAMLNANAFHANQAAEESEFSVSAKLMRPIISDAGSLARLHECYRTGLVIVEQNHLGRSWAVTSAAAGWLERNAERLDTPAHWRLAVFRWTDGGGGDACDLGAAMPPPDGTPHSTSPPG